MLSTYMKNFNESKLYEFMHHIVSVFYRYTKKVKANYLHVCQRSTIFIEQKFILVLVEFGRYVILVQVTIIFTGL